MILRSCGTPGHTTKWNFAGVTLTIAIRGVESDFRNIRHGRDSTLTQTAIKRSSYEIYNLCFQYGWGYRYEDLADKLRASRRSDDRIL